MHNERRGVSLRRERTAKGRVLVNGMLDEGVENEAGWEVGDDMM